MRDQDEPSDTSAAARAGAAAASASASAKTVRMCDSFRRIDPGRPLLVTAVRPAPRPGRGDLPRGSAILAYMASLDPIAFVRGTPPFDALPPPAFEEAARALEIVFLPANTRLLERGGTPSEHLYVIRKGSVRLERDGQTVQVLEQGEIFGFTSLISGAATLDVTVEEDLLAYRLPRAQFDSCLAHAPFAGHFASGLAERLRNSLERSQVTNFQPDLAVPVSTLLRGGIVRVAPGSTVGEAARVMAEHSISSVIVDSDPPGIVTDRDFRRRVLAAGRGPETPVLEVRAAPDRARRDARLRGVADPARLGRAPPARDA